MNPAIFENTRILPFSPEQVYRAHSDPALLAKWFGPNGFSSTFKLFEFKKNGRWLFTMHGPDGQDYENENVFRELIPNKKIVFEHIPLPVFMLTITLTEVPEGTHINWIQVLEDVEFANIIREKFPNANEQNLDRLHAVLRGEMPL